MSNQAEKFMESNKLSFRAVRVDSRTDGLGDIPTEGPMVNGDWARAENKYRRHFRVEFRTLANDFALVTFFSQGSAHTEKPSASEVLECLASDARSVVDCHDVWDFAEEFGWDVDSADAGRHLSRVFAGCMETHEALHTLLGGSSFEELMCLDFDEE